MSRKGGRDKNIPVEDGSPTSQKRAKGPESKKKMAHIYTPKKRGKRVAPDGQFDGKGEERE